jgi:non-homologous end joining protein Ku
VRLYPGTRIRDVDDLMATLKASVEAAKRKNDGIATPGRLVGSHRTG